jgi:hypothetical protein
MESNVEGKMVLQPAKHEVAFFKAGLFGEAGSGKSFTAVKWAIGIYAHIKSKKPIAFYDTEGGLSFLLHHFEKAGIKVLSVRSRSLSDLSAFLDEAKTQTDVCIIDSITHPWQAEMSAYKKKRGRSFISIRDWGPLKDTWREKFSEKYTQYPLHIIMCGRSSNIFEDVLDEDEKKATGKEKYESVKVGTKMKTEAETGYEPSLLGELEKVYLSEGGKYVRRLHIVKDRFDVIDSKDFDDPTFEHILPHVKLLNLGGSHNPLETVTSDEKLFDINNDKEKTRARISIALEKIENNLVALFPSTGGNDKQAKILTLKELTGTSSWSEIQNMHPDDLESYAKITDNMVAKGVESKNIESVKKLIADSRG